MCRVELTDSYSFLGGFPVPYVRRTKRRPSVSRRLKIIGAVCAVLAVALVVGGLLLMQQERLARGAAEAAQYTPAPMPSSTQADEQVEAAFIGDSYTAGAGATEDAKRWSTLVAEAQGWEETNLAFGGTGYATAVDGETAMDACGADYCPSYAEVIPKVAEASPEVVVVSGGRNDVGRGIDYESISAFYRDLRSALPDAQIVAVSPVWDAREAPAELSAIADAVSEAVTAVGGTYVDVGQPFAGKPEVITDDNVHPNDDGYQLLATAVIDNL